MSIDGDIQRIGKKSLMVWIPADLHKALKKKLAEDGLTAQAAIIWILTKYTGFKRTEENDAKGKGPATPEVNG